MKKLSFINGSLLLAVLAGARIVQVSEDGYDYHVVVNYPDLKEAEKADGKFSYELHKTCNYSVGKNEFTRVVQTNENGKVFKTDCESKAATEREFKFAYPKEANLCADNAEILVAAGSFSDGKVMPQQETESATL